MAFIVEDGTGVANANSYVTVLTFQEYCATRNIDVSADTEEAIQGYLVNGTDYIDLSYTFIGEATFDTQPLQFPRTKDDEEYGVPTKVQYATIEMALQNRAGTSLFSDEDKSLLSKKEKVGVIETEEEYDDSKVYKTNSSRFPKVNKLLQDWVDYLNGSEGQLRVISG